MPIVRLRRAYQANLSLCSHRLPQRPQNVKTVNCNGSRKARAHRALCPADLPPRVHTGGLLRRVKPDSPCRGFASGLVQRTCQEVPTVILTHSSHRTKKKNEWSRDRADVLSPRSNLTSAQCRRPLAQMGLTRQITILPLQKQEEPTNSKAAVSHGLATQPLWAPIYPSVKQEKQYLLAKGC